MNRIARRFFAPGRRTLLVMTIVVSMLLGSAALLLAAGSAASVPSGSAHPRAMHPGSTPVSASSASETAGRPLGINCTECPTLLGNNDCTDDDHDGYSECQEDCDDQDSLIYPGAPEICDFDDNDCDNSIDEDDDQDGYDCFFGDCDNTDPDVYPGATELCSDGVDQNCDSTIDSADNDGDGYDQCVDDCNDEDDTIHPGASEDCSDGVDQNCDQTADSADNDNDGFDQCINDCGDDDPTIHPGVHEVCGDSFDNDCNGFVDFADEDSDTYDACVDDCNDSDASVHPGATETCNGIDDNCDGGGTIDEGGAALCDDSNDCTDDACNGLAGCGHDPSANAEITVTDNGDNGPGTLRQAILDVCDGGVITIQPGLAPIQLFSIGDFTHGPSALLIVKTVTIHANGATIEALHFGGVVSNPQQRIFFVAPTGNLALDHATLQGGRAIGRSNTDCGSGISSGDGGAIYNEGTLTLSESTLTDNVARGGSGSICCFAEPPAGSDNALGFEIDAGHGRGGAIFNAPGSSAAIENCTFTGNQALGGTGGTDCCVFSGRGGDGFGGAIFNYNAVLNVASATIDANAVSGGPGGVCPPNRPAEVDGPAGSLASDPAPAALPSNGLDRLRNPEDSSLAGTPDAAGDAAVPGIPIPGVAGGGGIFSIDIADSTVLTLHNTILADTPNAASDCSAVGGTVNAPATNANLIEVNSGCGTPAYMTDPNLSPLGTNGGPTRTMALNLPSDAIDTGDVTSCPATDQRGVGRPLEGDGGPTAPQCDIGAFELGCETDDDCEDGLACTSDTCVINTITTGSPHPICVFTLLPGFCEIDGTCYSAGTNNPANDCEFCSPSANAMAFVPRPSGSTCNDGDGCTSSDQCDGNGACDGTDVNGQACDTGQPGVCAAGTISCTGGVQTCNRNTDPTPEECGDDLDNDCDGEVNEDCTDCLCDDGDACTIDDYCCGSSCCGDRTDGGPCNTGQPGQCAAGTTVCSGGTTTCMPNQGPGSEGGVCDGVDNDCDGSIDDPVGQPCTEGVGACQRSGTYRCESGGCLGAIPCLQPLPPIVCSATPGSPSTEICGNGIDEDCDGQTDETPCTSQCGSLPFADPFTSPALDSCWSFVDPVGNSAVSLPDGQHVRISVPAGTEHDCWSSGANCARIVRTVPSSDAVYETKIDGTNINQMNQDYGIFFFADSCNHTRFEFWSGLQGIHARVYRVASCVGQGPLLSTPSPIVLGASNFLRVTKTSNAYRFEYRIDGGPWTLVGTTNIAGFNFTQVGFFVLNAVNRPATLANVDYFNGTGPAPAHTLQITSGPTGSPNPVASAGTVNVSATANDSLGHTIHYAWTAMCDLPSNGSFDNAAIANPVFTAPANTTGVAKTCVIKLVVDDGLNGLSQMAQYNQTVNPEPPPPGTCGTFPVNDPFPGSSLDSCWVVTNPGGGTSSVATDHLKLTVPAGSTHDCWNSTAGCTRALRPVPNGDAVFETRIDGTNLASANQDYGILLFQNATNYMRFEFWNGGAGTYVRAYKIIGGSGVLPPSITTASPVALGASNLLRVTRSTNSYTLAYQIDGGPLTTVGSLTQAGFVVNEVGLFVNNAVGNPMTMGSFDYFTASGSPPPGDLTPPVRSNGQPTGTLPSGTTQATLSLTTDENANCRYGTVANTPYASLTPFTTTGGISHQTNVAVSDGNSYTFFVRCQDTSPNLNANTTDFPISFSVASPGGGAFPFNDPFSGAPLAGWTLSNPGGGTQTNTADHTQLFVPSGSAHDCWSSGLGCTRLLRTFPNQNAVYEAKIDGVNLASANQDYGIMLVQNATNFMRFEFWNGGAGTYVRAYKVIGGAGFLPPSITTGAPVALGAANSLRVTKSGNTFTLEYKIDGGGYVTAGSLTQAGFTIAQAGIFVNNAVGNPATTGNFDSFSATAGP